MFQNLSIYLSGFRRIIGIRGRPLNLNIPEFSIHLSYYFCTTLILQILLVWYAHLALKCIMNQKEKKESWKPNFSPRFYPFQHWKANMKVDHVTVRQPPPMSVTYYLNGPLPIRIWDFLSDRCRQLFNPPPLILYFLMN